MPWLGFGRFPHFAWPRSPFPFWATLDSLIFPVPRVSCAFLTLVSGSEDMFLFSWVSEYLSGVGFLFCGLFTPTCTPVERIDRSLSMFTQGLSEYNRKPLVSKEHCLRCRSMPCKPRTAAHNLGWETNQGIVFRLPGWFSCQLILTLSLTCRLLQLLVQQHSPVRHQGTRSVCMLNWFVVLVYTTTEHQVKRQNFLMW